MPCSSRQWPIKLPTTLSKFAMVCCSFETPLWRSADTELGGNYATLHMMDRLWPRWGATLTAFGYDFCRGSLSLTETSLVFWLLVDVAIQLVNYFSLPCISNVLIS